MHEKLLRLCFFAERCVILKVNKIRQPPGCSKGVNEIMKEYAFGIDLGGTTAKIGLFTTAGALLEKWEVPTDTSNAGEHILENLAAAIMGKMQEKAIPAEQVEGVGIGVPGPVLDSSVVPIVCANLGGWGQRNVSAQLSGLLDGLKVLVGNDANVAALGEIWMGTAKGCRSAVMVTLGTGVGGGTLIGLSKKLLDMDTVTHITELAEDGDLSRVDLRINDISSSPAGRLTETMTASNFGNISDLATKSDIALGIINLVFETIGMVSIFAARNHSIRDIVLTGNMTGVKQAKAIFSGLNSLFDMNFIIPEMSRFGTVIGAALSGIDSTYFE